MKFITEDELRDIYRKEPFTSYEIQPGARLTPGARQFLQDRQINVFEDGTTMHVGDGVVAGGMIRKFGEAAQQQNAQQQNAPANGPGNVPGTLDPLKIKKLGASLKSAEAEFLWTTSNLMDIDVCLAQEVLKLGRKFEEIKYMAKDESKTFEPLEFKACHGMTEGDFSCDIGECFDITEFHLQTEKGKQILLLHKLRCKLYEVQVTVMEIGCTNKAVMERLNQVINYIQQLICKAFGGGECQRQTTE